MCQEFWFLAENCLWGNFLMVVWIISEKTPNARFPAVKKFWKVLWHSNYHQSKALVKMNKLIYQSKRLECQVLPWKTKPSPLHFFKNTFLKIISGSQNSDFSRCLIFSKKFIFAKFSKNFENNPHNVYIFGTAHARPFQNRFKHVHTTFVDCSTTSQLGPLI